MYTRCPGNPWCSLCGPGVSLSAHVAWMQLPCCFGREAIVLVSHCAHEACQPEACQPEGLCAVRPVSRRGLSRSAALRMLCAASRAITRRYSVPALNEARAELRRHV